MYRTWIGAHSQISESSVSSGHKKQNRKELQSIGADGRDARGLAHDAADIQKQKVRRTDSLRTSPLFAGLSPLAELELCDSAIERSFSNRKVIFHEDDPVRFVDIVLRGSVKITQLSPEGGEVILRIDRSGDLIDGIGDLPEKVHTASAYAVRDCALLTWETSVFSSFAARFPEIQRNALAIMTARLRTLSQSFCDLSTARVPQRLARVLLRLTEPGCPGQQEPLGLSREELAQMIGTSLFTTSRLLRDWAEQGIVYVNRSGVMIEDMKSLVRLSLDGVGNVNADSPASEIWSDSAAESVDENDFRSNGTDN